MIGKSTSTPPPPLLMNDREFINNVPAVMVNVVAVMLPPAVMVAPLPLIVKVE